jgi:hypothetical protein
VRNDSESVLRLAILIADGAGEILFWNAEAQQALDRLGRRSVGRLDDLFTAETLEHMRGRRAWVAVSPRGAAGVSWRVRARQLLDSGRSLLLFQADPARF